MARHQFNSVLSPLESFAGPEGRPSPTHASVRSANVNQFLYIRPFLPSIHSKGVDVHFCAEISPFQRIFPKIQWKLGEFNKFSESAKIEDA